jgi:hypothetical protein
MISATLMLWGSTTAFGPLGVDWSGDGFETVLPRAAARISDTLKSFDAVGG